MADKIKTYQIYQLIDPRDSKPFYVGCTTRSLNTRLRYHLADENGSQRKRIIELSELGLIPEIESLDRITACKELANCLENLWMEHVNKHHSLVNQRRGCDIWRGLGLHWDNFETVKLFIHSLSNQDLNQIKASIRAWNSKYPANFGIHLAA